MAKLLLLDCDGTIREPLSGNKFISHPRDQKIVSGADKAIAHYHAKGWRVIGVTNQGGVGAGHKFLEDAIAEQAYTLELFPEIEAILFCPDFEGRLLYKVSRTEWSYFGGNQGEFRKPAPGMLYWAKYDVGQVDDWWYIGDRLEDEQAAAAAGVGFVWADVWRSRFLPGVHEMPPLSREQIGFLEDIDL